MALVSSAPKSCLHKSLIRSTHHELKPLRRTIPTLGMCRRGKSFTPSVSMSLTTAVSDDGLQRRIGDYHSNLWDDDFIQSLSTPYGEPSYRERAEKLIGEVKEMFNSMPSEDGESMSPLNDLIERLWMVDSVERLGIDRHFKKEIKSALDYVYSYWNEKGIGCGRDSVFPDVNSTASGFRTLRLHGYSVSSEVLKVFQDQNGQFAFSPSTKERDIRTVLNLYRASFIAFPGEKVMEEAEIFSSRYLKEAVQKIPVSSLSQEIDYTLEYGWHTNMPRLETRNYLDVFGHPTSPWLKKKRTQYLDSEKLLELAKLEFNIFHSLQQKELQYLSRWWIHSGLPELTFGRHRHVEYYTLSSCIATEPKHSAFRLGFAKTCHLITVLDDIYDTFGTMDEIELFNEAVRRWNPSEKERLPEYMKEIYMALYEALTDMAREAEKTQGRDTLNYARKAWEVYLDSYTQEAKWIASGYLPTFEEYLENAKVSSGHRAAALTPLLTLDVPLPDDVLKGIDFPSRFNDLASSFLRLRGDTRCYKADRDRGEEASSISCYMKDNPGLTEEDALNHINAMINDIIKELNWELLKPDSNIPMTARKHAYEITRAFHQLYKYRDGFSVATQETKSLVRRTVLEPVPL
uniref:Beta-phellandrene synthase, chloroplastic n=1 Tax=Abies grandis TaxID=46611 RepID=TPSD8_ABIGR|nr:RecName: Full=Beta-phellandrene synthase, chloroplastic; AltName: Full=(-)-(4S)-beta-phellandrene synthase; AltName: Full=Agg-Bphe; Flags: Precursor [Abies grandis]AAF61453.1 beta-phellandrene synthase [Abies grandis]